jgi:ribosomal-protein-alanine N-acetyltransferase
MIQGLIARLFGGARPPTVEPAALGDARRLAQLHAASFHRGWGTGEFEQLLIDRNVLIHRLRHKNRIIGFAVSRCAADEAEILSIAIDPRHRGRGLSRPLLLSHLGHLAGHGVTRVFLEVEENNEPARRLYEHAGFAVVGRREGYYRASAGPALNALVMRRDLS